MKTLENLPLTGFLDLTPARETINFEPARGTFLHKTLLEKGLAGYEQETLATMLALLEHSEDPFFIDVGANIGFYSAIVGALMGNHVKKIAFEPAPRLAQICEAIFQANDLNVDFRAMALGAREATADFYISPTDVSNSLREGFRKAVDVVKVKVSTLSAELATHNHVGAVAKIDTESTEGDVIEGAFSWIEKNKPWIICEVLFKLEDQRIPDLLGSLGYQFYHIGPKGLVKADQIAGEATYTYRDWLLAPQEVSVQIETRISGLLRQMKEYGEHTSATP